MLDARSKKSLAKAHPLLQKLFTAVADETDIIILDSTRGKAEQELAFARGTTKVQFGNSAHNYVPAIALDVCPAPIDWKNTKKFIILGKRFVLPIAKELGIPIRWGADWNMNSNLKDESFVDMPHYELHPWRSWAKKATLFNG
jgi:peptidoglycan L-alanyl-D-glutamate endopeptidase CwlK